MKITGRSIRGLSVDWRNMTKLPHEMRTTSICPYICRILKTEMTWLYMTDIASDIHSLQFLCKHGFVLAFAAAHPCEINDQHQCWLMLTVPLFQGLQGWFETAIQLPKTLFRGTAQLRSDSFSEFLAPHPPWGQTRQEWSLSCRQKIQRRCPLLPQECSLGLSLDVSRCLSFFKSIFCSLVPPTLCQNSLSTVHCCNNLGLKPFPFRDWCRFPLLRTERPVKRRGKPGDASRSWTSVGPTISASEVKWSEFDELRNQLILNWYWTGTG